MLDDGWTVVTANDKKRVMHKAGPRYRPQSCKRPTSTSSTVDHSSLLSDSDPSNKEALHKCIEKCSAILLKSDLLTNLCATLKRWNNLNESSGCIERIVAYGIGNFSKTRLSYCSASLWQLSLALCLKKLLKSDDSSSAIIDFYDPCTTGAEAHFLLERFDVNVLTANDQGNHPVGNVKTLFLMPHCPSQLYENVVWANFFNLPHIALIGNSLRNLAERHPPSGLVCLQVLLPYLNETSLLISKADCKKAEPVGNFFGAWNDTYVSFYHSQSWGDSVTSQLRPYECLNVNTNDTELL